MNPSLLTAPRLDPTPLFELYRGNFGSELLTAAVAHFHIFDRFVGGPKTADELRSDLGLDSRPVTVLLTALRAFGLLVTDGPGRLDLSELAREHLTTGSAFDVSDYIRMGADSPGVLTMVDRLRTNRPAGSKPEEAGAAFIYREGIESVMEHEEEARRLTLALAGRARNVAPVLAERVPLGPARVLLDVGGGTGLYSIAFLQRNPALRAIIWDRPEVLKVAAELAAAHGVADRLECRPGDMFTDQPPPADVVLLSNVLHDWDINECRTLIARCAAVLPRGGRLLIHDVFLNDALDGPLAIALYSAALFCLTEGRAYSAGEYSGWLREAGLTPGPITTTLIHCGALPGVKQS
ncbi:MAG TPA: methyltransferase [Planctomycetales bacterium]|nr:methyltransferase [Planctomycetales bacterium]